MGIFTRKPKAPALYQGQLIEAPLYPKTDLQHERRTLLGSARSKNFWCDLRGVQAKAGKYAGSTYMQVWVGKVLVGEMPPRYIVGNQSLLDALNTGINAATVWLHWDEDGNAAATLRLGNHPYMPAPYWTD